MNTEYCSINEPSNPHHAANHLIRDKLLPSGDLPWVNDMTKAWNLMEMMIKLSEYGVINIINCVEHISTDCPTSQRIMSFKHDQTLPYELENKAFYHCFFSLPRKEENDNCLTCETVWYDFLHERPEMAIYSMALKVAELLKDEVIPRKWLRIEEQYSPEMLEIFERHVRWMENENVCHEG